MLKMAANKQALKRSAQITNNSSISTPRKRTYQTENF
jgi:hypothetical protein